MKYSLSNKSVAERRRADLPEAAASLMAQEQKYKYPVSVCPIPHLPGIVGQQQKEDPPQPKEDLALGTCLPWPYFVLLSGPNRSVLPFLPPTET